MTKLRMHKGLLAYRQEMQEALRQVRQSSIGGIPKVVPLYVPLASPGLLPPPSILLVSLNAYKGGQDDFIGIAAVHTFDLAAMYVDVSDGDGNLIETGDAYPYADAPELWGFYPAVHVLPGACVTVHVTAVDCMGGIGRGWAGKRMGEDS